MISFLSGTVFALHFPSLTLLVGGVGYKVHIPSHTFETIKEKDTLSLYIHFVSREDAQELFGFTHQNELRLFELLISISGVGPRSALGIISLDSVSALSSAIAQSNIEYLTRVSGIGKKSAEKIVLELKDKVKNLTEENEGNILTQDTDIIEALISLGYSKNDAREVLREINPTTKDQGERIKEALRLLTQ
jgi:holliday junction DNA helicase RuvA